MRKLLIILLLFIGIIANAQKTQPIILHIVERDYYSTPTNHVDKKVDMRIAITENMLYIDGNPLTPITKFKELGSDKDGIVTGEFYALDYDGDKTYVTISYKTGVYAVVLNYGSS